MREDIAPPTVDADGDGSGLKLNRKERDELVNRRLARGLPSGDPDVIEVARELQSVSRPKSAKRRADNRPVHARYRRKAREG